MRNARGFSLIEILFALAMVSLLLMLGLPSYQAWIQNTKIRMVAESIFNGMQLAKAEAIRRNVNVGFYLVDSMTASCSTDGSFSNWVVSLQDPSSACNQAPSETLAPQIIQKRLVQEGRTEGIVVTSSAVTATAVPDQIIFTPLGRGNNPNNQFLQIDVSISPAISGARPLRIQVGAGGSLKLCYPSSPSIQSTLSTTDPRGC